jgi:hypothetical protein
MSNTWPINICKVKVSTPFVFETVAYQNSANQVYEYVKAYNTANNASVTGSNYKFKSDYERMQYLLGQKARSPGCAGQYGFS